MQKLYETDRDLLYLLLLVLTVGIVIGLLLAPRRAGRQMRRITDKKRANANFVFGNIIIGSNNGRDTQMPLGLDDSGDND